MDYFIIATVLSKEVFSFLRRWRRRQADSRWQTDVITVILDDFSPIARFKRIDVVLIYASCHDGNYSYSLTGYSSIFKASNSYITKAAPAFFYFC